jgi:hypothetical protein
MRALRVVTVTAVAGFALGSAASSSASVYAGETAQSDPIAITVSKDGKRVQKIAVDWDSLCKSGKYYQFGGVLTARAKVPGLLRPGDYPLLRGAISKGRLNATGAGAEDFGEGVSGSIRQTVKGKFRKTSASGTWSGHLDVRDAGGSVIDTCDTGTIPWVTLRGPTSYGGTTTQGEPVVIVTTKDRTRVTYFGIGWFTDCSGGGFFKLGDETGNFPLTAGGLFGDDWNLERAFSDGTGKATYAYHLQGSLKKGRGSGTFSVTRAEVDNAGTTTATCDLQGVRWSVTQ